MFATLSPPCPILSSDEPGLPSTECNGKADTESLAIPRRGNRAARGVIKKAEEVLELSRK